MPAFLTRSADQCLDLIHDLPPHEALNQLWQQGVVLRTACEYTVCNAQWQCNQFLALVNIKEIDDPRGIEASGMGANKSAAKSAASTHAIIQIAANLNAALGREAWSPVSTVNESTHNGLSSDDSGYNSASGSSDHGSSPLTEAFKTVPAAGIHHRKSSLNQPAPGMHHAQFETSLNMWEHAGIVPFVCAVDLEVSEVKNEKGSHDILQVGLTVGRIDEYPASCNLVVREHKEITNQFCPTDHTAFSFGPTLERSMEEIQSLVQTIMDAVGGAGGMVIGHTLMNDVAWLKCAGVDVKGDKLDIAEVQRVFDNTLNKKSLATMVTQYTVPRTAPLHNAGNDAWFTFACFREMVYKKRPHLLMA